MKLDSAIRSFSERYDRDALASIDRISKDHALVAQRHTLKGFKITESFDQFCEYLQGYASYKIENANNEKASNQEVICESVSRFIDTQLFESCEILYPDLPKFVTAYANGVQKLTETVDQVKEKLIDAGFDEAAGDVNGFADEFMTHLDEAFHPTMDRFLWASGYNSYRALHTPKKKPTPAEVPTFI